MVTTRHPGAVNLGKILFHVNNIIFLSLFLKEVNTIYNKKKTVIHKVVILEGYKS